MSTIFTAWDRPPRHPGFELDRPDRGVLSLPPLFALGDPSGSRRGARHGPGVGGFLPGLSRSGQKEPFAEPCARGRRFVFPGPRRSARCPRRSFPRHRPGAVRAIVFLALILAIPVIVAANPVDPDWLSGWYDEADTDQLVTQTMSPESLIGVAVLLLVCFSAGARLMNGVAREYKVSASREPVSRGPPLSVSMPGSGGSLISSCLQSALLNQLIVRVARPFLFLNQESFTGLCLRRDFVFRDRLAATANGGTSRVTARRRNGPDGERRRHVHHCLATDQPSGTGSFGRDAQEPEDGSGWPRAKSSRVGPTSMSPPTR